MDHHITAVIFNIFPTTVFSSTGWRRSPEFRRRLIYLAAAQFYVVMMSCEFVFVFLFVFVFVFEPPSLSFLWITLSEHSPSSGTGWCPGCSHQFRWNISGCSRLSFPLQGVLWICLHFIWKSPFSPFLWNQYHWWMNISCISQRSGRCYSHPPERPGKYYHADLPRCPPCSLVKLKTSHRSKTFLLNNSRVGKYYPADSPRCPTGNTSSSSLCKNKPKLSRWKGIIFRF